MKGNVVSKEVLLNIQDQIKQVRSKELALELFNELKQYKLEEFACIEQVDALEKVIDYYMFKNDEITDFEHLTECKQYVNTLTKFVKYPHSFISETGQGWRLN